MFQPFFKKMLLNAKKTLINSFFELDVSASSFNYNFAFIYVNVTFTRK